MIEFVGSKRIKKKLLFRYSFAASNTSDDKVAIILSSVGVVVAGSSVAFCIFWTRTKYTGIVRTLLRECFSWFDVESE